ncbi:hypothetical protein [Streptomyces sp. NBC_00154]|uniref:hypothetical protein n=1 Tax=Streptomyces sp. NBC_00154 TaxID=2975670 RepID=UPI002254C30B|nr:hypothetical protein [Streptomyces sp. NBC_00154]MCX5316010.1 hypothetical protein [Streptomyces sp. NBC_00154]
MGDGKTPSCAEELGEDPPDRCGGGLVDRQRAQQLVVGGLGRVRVRTDIDQLYP